jgi:hypothetical protein
MHYSMISINVRNKHKPFDFYIANIIIKNLLVNVLMNSNLTKG